MKNSLRNSITLTFLLLVGMVQAFVNPVSEIAKGISQWESSTFRSEQSYFQHNSYTTATPLGNSEKHFELKAEFPEVEEDEVSHTRIHSLGNYFLLAVLLQYLGSYVVDEFKRFALLLGRYAKRLEVQFCILFSVFRL